MNYRLPSPQRGRGVWGGLLACGGRSSATPLGLSYFVFRSPAVYVHPVHHSCREVLLTEPCSLENILFYKQIAALRLYHRVNSRVFKSRQISEHVPQPMGFFGQRTRNSVLRNVSRLVPRCGRQLLAFNYLQEFLIIPHPHFMDGLCRSSAI